MRFNQHQYKLLSHIFSDLGKAILLGGAYNVVIAPKETLSEQLFHTAFSVVLSLMLFYNWFFTHVYYVWDNSIGRNVNNPHRENREKFQKEEEISAAEVRFYRSTSLHSRMTTDCKRKDACAPFLYSLFSIRYSKTRR